jgi:transcriptional regulator with XRE-family HTH domain
MNKEDLKAIRLGLKLSQADFASKLGITRVQVNRLENGKQPIQGSVEILALTLSASR